jgi:hypothetical protein
MYVHITFGDGGCDIEEEKLIMQVNISSQTNEKFNLHFVVMVIQTRK